MLSEMGEDVGKGKVGEKLWRYKPGERGKGGLCVCLLCEFKRKKQDWSIMS